jgi:hypothetical protein
VEKFRKWALRWPEARDDRGELMRGEGEHVRFVAFLRVVGRFIRQLIRSEVLWFEK